jgi:hypothetical protein
MRFVRIKAWASPGDYLLAIFAMWPVSGFGNFSNRERASA